ncbi:MAG: hypothetical protein WBL06_04875 [Pseudolysinimonas sp.]|uniref:hypothetical protein n=1 Tax=Pseudolysinimonas sp. TaxID=2680009 RepID=UPI003C778336
MIELPYGAEQSFRPHHADINVIGSFLGALPVRSATWQLNSGASHPFWVEPDDGSSIDFSYQYKTDSVSRLRLPYAGDFNVEIPTDHRALRAGSNDLTLRVVDADGVESETTIQLTWSAKLPEREIRLDDLSGIRSPQQLGQVVNGRWDVDPILNVVRTRGPVSPDSLLLLGPAQASQEAEYQFRYFDGSRSKYIGLSDFFVGHEFERPAIPIKPGWSTAGLATSRPRGEGAWETRLWIADGDRPGWRPSSAEEEPAGGRIHLVRTDPAVYFEFTPRRWYHVRHRLEVAKQRVRASLRVWPVGSTEPDAWLCDESDVALDKYRHASFGLFQHSGLPSEWRSIHLRPLG